MKILLTGANGQIGWELCRSLACMGHVLATTRRTLDLTKPADIRSLMREMRPDVVVNAAAYTDVDKAESEESLAFAVNAEAPRVLAEEAARLRAGLVHYSTDYVFDGAKTTPYLEDDAPNPLGVYGRTKLAGECAIKASGSPSIILRTTWVYADRGRNFLLSMLQMGRDCDHLRVVADQWGAPTPARLVAELSALLLAQLSNNPRAQWPRGEIFHASCAGATTWHGFASKIISEDTRRNSRALPTIEAITTSEYSAAAARPRNSILSNEKLITHFRFRLPDWKDALELFFNAYERKHPSKSIPDA